ncbi:hypothetical protein HK096_008488 [Nowakowskiella sp. JEL0078]|nr:hypothetical protein HK096_008488 [Nowakowskiella sp. JEL0078]
MDFETYGTDTNGLDYPDSNHLIKDVIKFISRPKYNDHLINYTPETKVKIIMRDSHFVKITYQPAFINNSRTKDLDNPIYPSLSKLGKAFDVPIKKGSFPHEFASFDNLTYVGVHPVTGVPDWDFKVELLTYLISDVVSLWQVINKFREHIFLNHRVNILKYPTLASLSFAIYRTQFLTKNQIVSLSGNIDLRIRESYFGGLVDVYKPYGRN